MEEKELEQPAAEGQCCGGGQGEECAKKDCGCEETEAQECETAAENISPEEALSAELEALKDKHVRLMAEFDNFRRRTLKEKMELVKSGGEDTIKKLLPVIDDFERAYSHIGQASELDAVKEGISLIQSKFAAFLTQNGVSEIEALEKEFDTDLHEALTKIPASGPELQGKVVDVVEKGYMLHDKVLRFAKVVVGE
jgi:molecular chaperone GrpE